MQELLVDKIHFFSFLSMSDKLRLQQLKFFTSSRSSTAQASVTALMFSSVRGNTIKELEIPYVGNKYKNLTNLSMHAKISYFIASLVFRKFSYRTYRNDLNRVPQS